MLTHRSGTYSAYSPISAQNLPYASSHAPAVSVSGLYSLISKESRITRLASHISANSPAAIPCMAMLPREVASTGPALTSLWDASAAN